MKSFYLQVLILLLFSFELCGRSTLEERPYLQTLAGTVINESNETVELGNVLLRSLVDSSLVKGEVFYDGTILLPDVSIGSYLLQVTSLGYTDHFQRVHIAEEIDTLHLETIVLELDELTAVEVTAQRKVYTQTGNGLIVNVAQTALANAGSVEDLLRNSPKVITDRAGGFALLGKGAATVYLDGQRLASLAILGTLSAQDIKRIEILENPPARFDAEGNGVINIVTNGKGQEGYRLTYLQEFGQGRYFRTLSRASAYYKAGKLFVQGSAGIQTLTWGNRFGQQRTYPDDYHIDNYYRVKMKRRPQNYDVRIGYELSPRHQVQLHCLNSTLRGEVTGNNQRAITENETEIFSLDSKVGGAFNQRNESYQFLSTHTIDTLGSSLQFGAQYTAYVFDRSDRIRQTVGEAERFINRQSLNRNDIEVRSGQVDYEQYLKPGVRLAAGAKISSITNNSFSGLEEITEEGQRQPLPEFTNGFDYEEHIVAGYLEASTEHQNWKFSAGLRSEWTKSLGQSGTTNLFDRNYLNFFPSASVTRKLNENTSLSLSYGYRINRPLFQDLNPYIVYVDSLVSLRGNPNLLPEYSHNLSGVLNHGGWNLNLGYIYTPGKINQLFRSPDPARPEVIAFVKENLLYTKLYSATVSRALSGKSWSAYLTLGVFYDDHAISDLEQQLVNTKTGVYLRIAPSLSLPGKMKFNASLNYTSPRVDGVYEDQAVSFINLSLSRKFVGDRLTTTLWANDIFRDYRFNGVTNFNGTRMEYLTALDWHFVKIMFNWNFGKLGNRNWRTKRGAGSEDQRILRN